MKSTALFFDLDGTLVDTVDDIAAAVNLTLVQHGLAPCTREECQSYLGRGSHHLISRAFKTADQNLIARYYDEYLECYLSQISLNSSPYRFVRVALARAAAAGYELVVFTNKPEAAAKLLLLKLFPNIAFRAVCSPSATCPPKPDPTGLINTIKALGLKPEEIVYFGDSSYDMEAAKKALIPHRIGCLYGYQDRERLLEGGATELIASGREMSAVIDRCGRRYNLSSILLALFIFLLIAAVNFFFTAVTPAIGVQIAGLAIGSVSALFGSLSFTLSLTRVYYLEPLSLFGTTSALLASTLFIYVGGEVHERFDLQNTTTIVLLVAAIAFAAIFAISSAVAVSRHRVGARGRER